MWAVLRISPVAVRLEYLENWLPKRGWAWWSDVQSFFVVALIMCLSWVKTLPSLKLHPLIWCLCNHSSASRFHNEFHSTLFGNFGPRSWSRSNHARVYITISLLGTSRNSTSPSTLHRTVEKYPNVAFSTLERINRRARYRE